jgi:hypothetical protein
MVADIEKTIKLYLEVSTVKNIKIFVPKSKESILIGKKITIDAEGLLFIKKLIIKDLDIVLI